MIFTQIKRIHMIETTLDAKIKITYLKSCEGLQFSEGCMILSLSSSSLVTNFSWFSIYYYYNAI